MNDHSNSEHKTRHEVKKEILERLWEKFNLEFPENEDVLEEMYKRAFEADSINCRSCGATDFERRRGDRVGKCNSCGKSMWMFADTFFCGMRTKTATAWLAAIYFKEHGQLFSASMFHTIVGVAQSTAHGIIKRIEIVQASLMQNDAALVASSNFMRVFCKRSRETPAREHPRAEEDVVSREEQYHHSDDANDQRGHFAENFDMEEDTQKIFHCLSGSPLSTEDLCQATGLATRDVSSALSYLELSGFIERLPGDRHVRCKNVATKMEGSSCNEEIRHALSHFLQTAMENWHGISRKYLQLYLASYSGQLHQRKWSDKRLLSECIRFGPVKYDDILTYVSSPFVCFPLMGS